MINWALLSWAMSHYRAHGYTEVDVPWWVGPEVSSLTCPDQSRAYPLATGEVLVGSAEQSFLAMAKAGTLPAGQLVACTPCFRNEPVVDALHQTHFMKVELFAPEASAVKLSRLRSDALVFFSLFCSMGRLQTINTEDGYDITLDGVEIGSYGIREIGGLAWTYGTGLAEPRFSRLIKY